MSDTKSLVCDDCRASIWIGQDRYAGGHLVIYTADHDVMEHLRLFLSRHEGHSLRFVGENDNRSMEYADEGPEDDERAASPDEGTGG
jgi:hypothetical protein